MRGSDLQYKKWNDQALRMSSRHRFRYHFIGRDYSIAPDAIKILKKKRKKESSNFIQYYIPNIPFKYARWKYRERCYLSMMELPLIRLGFNGAAKIRHGWNTEYTVLLQPKISHNICPLTALAIIYYIIPPENSRSIYFDEIEVNN